MSPLGQRHECALAPERHQQPPNLSPNLRSLFWLKLGWCPKLQTMCNRAILFVAMGDATLHFQHVLLSDLLCGSFP